jgi:hypothetical protein
MADREEVVVVKRRGRGLRLLLGLILLAVVVAVVAVVVVATKESSDAADDVTITTCEPAEGGGGPTASGQIDNATSKDSNYTIRLEFLDPDGNTVSQGATSVRDVGAGEAAEWELTGAQDVEGGVRCELAGVSRTNLPGQ